MDNREKCLENCPKCQNQNQTIVSLEKEVAEKSDLIESMKQKTKNFVTKLKGDHDEQIGKIKVELKLANVCALLASFIRSSMIRHC